MKVDRRNASARTGTRSRSTTRRSARKAAWSASLLLAASTAWSLVALATSSASAQNMGGGAEDHRTDPNIEGGARYGDDDADDDFTGYPVDPGEPGDAYYDVTREYRPYTPNFNGAFVSLAAALGPTWIGNAGLSASRPGIATSVAARLSNATQLLDAQLSYTHSRFQGVGLEDARGGEGPLRLDSAALTLAGHPFFFAFFGGDRFSYFMAGLYAAAGISHEWVSFEPDGRDGDYRTFALHLGGGFDTYLDDPHDGGAWWVGSQWRWSFIPGNRDLDIMRSHWVESHYLLVRIAYRYNGLIVPARVPGPNPP